MNSEKYKEVNKNVFRKYSLNGGELYYADSRNIESYIEKNTVDFIVTSPPYWAIRNYGYDNQIGFGQEYNDYLNDLKLVFKGCYASLKEGRWIGINVGTVVSKEGMKFLSGDIVRICSEIGFTFRKDIIWNKPRGQTKWQRGGTQFAQAPYPRHYNTNINHEFILLFSKGIVQRNGKEEHQDVPEFEQYSRQYVRQVAYSVWDIPPVNSPRLDEKHAAPFPKELPQRLIELFTYPMETVLDPFSGAGTTLRVAKKLGRKFLGIDLNENYIEYSRSKLNEINIPDYHKICIETAHRFDISTNKKLDELNKKKKDIEREFKKLQKEILKSNSNLFS